MSSEFKIRTLPRKDEVQRRQRRAITWRYVAYGVGVFVVILGVGLALPKPKPAATKNDLSSHQPARDPMATRLNAFVQDVKMKEEIMRQRSQLENLRTKAPDQDPDAGVPSRGEPNRNLGVTLESENTADRLYQELNDRPSVNVDMLPENRINARLEKNKWMNQLDRQERVQFVRNFIKTAYDRGYEVELDQNLVVIGVKPIVDRKISLDQVIDRIDKQGL